MSIILQQTVRQLAVVGVASTAQLELTQLQSAGMKSLFHTHLPPEMKNITQVWKF